MQDSERGGGEGEEEEETYSHELRMNQGTIGRGRVSLRYSIDADIFGGSSFSAGAL